MWQAPLSSIHSLPSSREVSVEDHPRAVYCQGLYFVGLARTLPPLPIHHPLVFSKKLSRIPKEDPPQRRQDGRSPRERKACARRSPRIAPLRRECKGYGIVWAPW